MKMERTSVHLVLTFGLWLGLILGCSSLRNSAPIKISAEDLSKAYESNENSANDRYKGETLIVTGMVGVTNIPEGATPPPRDPYELRHSVKTFVIHCNLPVYPGAKEKGVWLTARSMR